MYMQTNKKLQTNSDGLVEHDGDLITPAHMAYRNMKIQEERMELYRQRFEDDMSINYKDLWQYIENKLAHEGENVFTVDIPNTKHAREMNEAAEIEEIAKMLEGILSDPDISDKERHKAEITLKLLKLRPFQKQMRDNVLQRYTQNKIALMAYRQQTQGDLLYERQLVDREFYKRPKIYSSSKKEARTLDRFEQQMRSGQELRKKTRHKEFLNEILFHAKEFTEFHKKKVNHIRKKAQLIKASLESKEKKEQMAKDKEERDRIKALKDNDFDAYINMINTQKNSRLLQILEQTHKYLEQLGAKVNLQKLDHHNKKKKMLGQKASGLSGDQPTSDGEEEMSEKEEKEEEKAVEDENVPENERIKMNLKNSSKIYYSITHTV